MDINLRRWPHLNDDNDDVDGDDDHDVDGDDDHDVDGDDDGDDDIVLRLLGNGGPILMSH